MLRRTVLKLIAVLSTPLLNGISSLTAVKGSRGIGLAVTLDEPATDHGVSRFQSQLNAFCEQVGVKAVVILNGPARVMAVGHPRTFFSVKQGDRGRLIDCRTGDTIPLQIMWCETTLRLICTHTLVNGRPEANVYQCSHEIRFEQASGAA